MKVSPGSRWRSAVCDTEVVVVKGPREPGVLACGGTAMLAMGAERPAGAAPDPQLSGGTQLGKRYADEMQGLELLCTKAGKGSLTFEGRPLTIRAATRLPSSD